MDCHNRNIDSFHSCFLRTLKSQKTLFKSEKLIIKNFLALKFNQDLKGLRPRPRARPVSNRNNNKNIEKLIIDIFSSNQSENQIDFRNCKISIFQKYLFFKDTQLWLFKFSSFSFSPVVNSVTRLGDFQSSWSQIFLQKYPKTYMDFFDYFENNTFQVKTVVPTFVAAFGGRNWTTFYFRIWSHWLSWIVVVLWRFVAQGQLRHGAL